MLDGDTDASSQVTRPKPRLHPAIWIVLLAVLGFATYANTLKNQALLHYAPNPFGDPVLDDSLLRNARLLPKLFTGESFLTTYGEYRPAGYALFAMIHGVMPRDGLQIWHVLLIGLHVLCAVLVFLMMRMLVRDATAAVFAAVYLVHPLFGPLVNDLNTIYFLFGLLFSLLTLWLFLVYARTNSVLYLLGSIASFLVSAFTYKHAVVVPAFLIILHLYHDTHPRAAAAVLVYLALGAFAAGILHVPALATLGGFSMLVLVTSAGVSTAKGRYVALAKRLSPYVAVIALYFVFSAAVPPKPILDVVLNELKDAEMIAPCQPWFVSRRLLGGSWPHVVGLLVAGLVPLLLAKWRARYVPGAIALVFLAIVTMGWNRNYLDDVGYWKRLNEMGPERPALRLNLATAYVEDKQWGPAKDILMYYFCGPPIEAIPFAGTVQAKLGKLFAGTGNDRLAAYCFFSTAHWRWNWRRMKHLLNDAADFSFRRGFLSAAECNWASGLVLDPYDVRLYNDLGRVLVYKNFFRAASRYFRHTLSLDPDNATALYYLAFVAKLGDKADEYERYRARWQVATGNDAEIDFAPIYAGYQFDRDKMREWFSGNPTAALCRQDLVTTYRGKTYSFWEVPLEKGKYFMRRENYGDAKRHLSQAHEMNPESKEVLKCLVETYRHLGQVEDVERLEGLLKGKSDGT